MCMQDWRIGRLIKPSLLANQFTTLFNFNADPQRVGLILSLYDSAFTGINYQASIDFGGNAQAVGNICFSLTDSPLVISFPKYGLLPSLPFTITPPGNNISYSVIGMYMPEKYIQAGLEEFEREFNSWNVKR